MGFRKDFMWGTASAAYQVEGAYDEDGKGMNIWDVYTNLAEEPEHVKHRETGNTACDHYHRYKEDIAAMKEIGIKYYRFSINWTRILPSGTGEINQKGIDFYSSLVDELVKNDIVPMVTLFHWDYPYDLMLRGGWLNPDSSDWFAEYTKIVVDALSDRVKYWMTLNEPQCFIGLGYFYAKHAPFIKMSNYDIFRMTHNVLLAHGKAVRVIRDNAKTEPVVGFAFASACCTPYDDTEEEIEAARRRSFDINKYNFTFSATWWADPVFFGKYSDKVKELTEFDPSSISDEDMKIITEPVDFYGLNIYESRCTEMKGSYLEGSYQGIARTSMSWPVTPASMYWSAKFLTERYNVPLMITENGMANNDWVHLDGCVHDPQRIDFTARYLRELRRAADEGIDILGYMHWSVLDNFEWAEGYDRRFGLVYVDYRTQERVIKDSGYWYKTVIESNGENV